jgi:hypothetical protein
MKVAIALALCGTVFCSAPVGAAQDAASPAWISERVKLWINVCPSTAPTFAKFKAAARANGFSPGSGGVQQYKRTEIVASLKASGSRCNCLFSFGTDDPKRAANMMLSKLRAKYGSKFEPDDDPKSLGKLRTSDGDMSISVQTYKNAGLDWVGAVVHGRQKCPA